MRKHFEQCLSAKVHTFLNNSPATARNLKHDQGHPEFCLQSTTNCAHNGFKQDPAVTGAPIAISIARLRVPNMMKHVCVAARIGDGKAPGEGNSRSIAKTSNAASADSGCNPSGWHEFWPMALSKGPLLRMTKPQDFLLALSQNRDSASRVSLC